MLPEQGDVAGACAAYRQAVRSGHREFAPRAAIALGVVLAELGDVAVARAAFQQAVDSGHPEFVPRATEAMRMLLGMRAGDDPAGDASEQRARSAAAKPGRRKRATMAGRHERPCRAEGDRRVRDRRSARCSADPWREGQIARQRPTRYGRSKIVTRCAAMIVRPEMINADFRRMTASVEISVPRSAQVAAEHLSANRQRFTGEGSEIGLVSGVHGSDGRAGWDTCDC